MRVAKKRRPDAEAVFWTGHNAREVIAALANHLPPHPIVIVTYDAKGTELSRNLRLTGTGISASANNWLVAEPSGNLTVLSDDVFRKRYDFVPDGEVAEKAPVIGRAAAQELSDLLALHGITAPTPALRRAILVDWDGIRRLQTPAHRYSDTKATSPGDGHAPKNG